MRRAILNVDNGELEGELVVEGVCLRWPCPRVRTKDSEISSVTWSVKCHELSLLKRVCESRTVHGAGVDRREHLWMSILRSIILLGFLT